MDKAGLRAQADQLNLHAARDQRSSVHASTTTPATSSSPEACQNPIRKEVRDIISKTTGNRQIGARKPNGMPTNSFGHNATARLWEPTSSVTVTCKPLELHRITPAPKPSRLLPLRLAPSRRIQRHSDVGRHATDLLSSFHSCRPSQRSNRDTQRLVTIRIVLHPLVHIQDSRSRSVVKQRLGAITVVVHRSHR